MPIFTLLATAILGEALASTAIIGSFTVGAATAAALAVASEVGLSYAVRALMGQTPSGASTFGIQGAINTSPAPPRSIIFGETATAGSLVWANTWGAEVDPADGAPHTTVLPNAYLTMVIALADLPIQDLTGVWVDGVKLTETSFQKAGTGLGTQIASFIGPKNGGGTTPYLYIKWYDGTQTVADDFVITQIATTDRPWGETAVGVGIPYAIVTCLANDKFFSGFPTFRFEVKGMKLYDPSKDDTAGGSGSHRFDTPTTWGGDGDFLPAVQLYNLFRGITYNDNTWANFGTSLYGVQNMNAARLSNTEWIAAINDCRATIEGVGGLEPTYRSGGEIPVSAKLGDTVNALLASCAGRIPEIGGVYKLYVGAPGNSVASFSDDQIISSESQTFTPFFQLDHTTNGITATYPSPSNGWNDISAPPLYNSTFEAQDGGRRLLTNVQLPFVPYDAQVQRLMTSALAETRRSRQHIITLPPEYWALEPGDVVSWTSNRNGYDAKKFRVDGITDKANLDVMVALTEVDPADYSWNQASDFKAPFIGTPSKKPEPSQDGLGFSAVGTTITSSDGLQVRAAILLSWDNTQVGVFGVQWEIAQSGVTLTRGNTLQYAAGSTVIANNAILGKQTYQIRAQYIPAWPREMAWSDYITVVTPDASLSLADFDLALQKQVTDIQDYLNDKIDAANNLISSAVSDMNSHVYNNTQAVRQDIVTVDVAASDAKAAAVAAQATGSTALTVANDANSALATFSTNVTATLGPSFSTVNTVSQAFVDHDTALAIYKDGVTATFGPNFSSVNTVSSAVATLTGYAAASYAVTLDVNGYVSGYQLVNGGGGVSSFTVTVDKFQIAAPSVFGGSAVPIFTVANVNGSPKVALRGDMYIDGAISARMMQVGSITAINGAIDALAVQSLNIAGSAVTVPVADIRTDLVAGGTDVTANAVNVVIDTTGLSGATISILITWSFLLAYSGVSSGTFDSFNGIWVNGAINYIWAGGVTQQSASLSSLYTFTANGSVMTIPVSAVFGMNTSGVSIGKRVLSCLAVKR